MKNTKKKVVVANEEQLVSLPPELVQFIDEAHTKEQLAELYQTETSKLTGKVVDAELSSFAVTAVVNEMRKEKKRSNFVRAEADQVVGFIMGDSGTWDKIANMIAAAKAYIKKTSIAQAVQENYINGDGQVLDRRDKIFGKANEHYLEPLKENVSDCTRTLYLIGRIGEDATFKRGTIQTNDAPLCRAWGKAATHQFLPCTTFGIVKENTADNFKLNASKAEETTSVFKALNEEMDCGQIFIDVVTPQLTEITKVERMYELISEAWDRFLMVKGKVSWIARDRPSPFGAINMGIMDDSGNELVVSLPEQVSKDFGELSEVIVYGKPDRGDLKVVDESTGKAIYQKGKGEVMLKAVGVYVVKATPADVYSSDASNGEDIEGWVA